jgi:hypothetical protein
MEVPSMPAPASPPARLAGAARPRAHAGARLVGRALAALVLVAGVLGAGVGVLAVEAAPASAAERCGSTLPAGQVRVVVVVDPGTGGSPGATCLVVPEGTTGSQLLAYRADLFPGVQRPRYAESGLLCAIDGYPAEGCGDRTSGGYLYWSYWSGTSGSWVYGQGNPFVRRVRDGDIEGWRFVDGSGSGSDPFPRVSPSPTLFPALAPPPAPAPAPPAPAPDQGSGGAPSAGAPGSRSVPSGGGTTTSAPGEADAAAAPQDASSTTADTASPTTSAGVDEQAVEELAVMPTSSGGGSSGAAVGVVVVVVLTVGIGAAAIVQARRRRSEAT